MVFDETLRQNATQDESVDGIAGDARVDVDDGVDDLHHQSERTTVLNVKGRTTEDGLEDGDADAPDVGFGSASRVARGEALRGHVDDGTVETPRRRRSRVRGGAQSEIAEFTRPRFVEQDVARFDVAMDDARDVVKKRQRVRETPNDAQGGAGRRFESTTPAYDVLERPHGHHLQSYEGDVRRVVKPETETFHDAVVPIDIVSVVSVFPVLVLVLVLIQTHDRRRLRRPRVVVRIRSPRVAAAVFDRRGQRRRRRPPSHPRAIATHRSR